MKLHRKVSETIAIGEETPETQILISIESSLDVEEKWGYYQVKTNDPEALPTKVFMEHENSKIDCPFELLERVYYAVLETKELHKYGVNVCPDHGRYDDSSYRRKCPKCDKKREAEEVKEEKEAVTPTGTETDDIPF